MKYYWNPSYPAAKSRRAPAVVTRLPHAVRYPIGGAKDTLCQIGKCPDHAEVPVWAYSHRLLAHEAAQYCAGHARGLNAIERRLPVVGLVGVAR